MDAEIESYVSQAPALAGVNTVVYREAWDAIAPPGALKVDVVVTLSDPISFSDNDVIALINWPAKTISRGAQQIRQGETQVFHSVDVVRGSELVVLLDDNISCKVSVVPVGQGNGNVPAPKPDPVTAGLEHAGDAIGGSIGFILIVLVGLAIGKSEGWL